MKRAPCRWLWLLLCSIALPAAATAVHRWVDADGVTHFSDAPPAGGAAQVSMIELDDDFGPAPDPQADYYSIANQWKRMREEREAKTRLRLEKARIRASESAKAEPPPDYATYRAYPVYVPPYGYYHAYGRGLHQVNTGGGHIDGIARRSRGPSGGGVGLGRGVGPVGLGRTVGPSGGHRPAYHNGSGVSFGFSLR